MFNKAGHKYCLRKYGEARPLPATQPVNTLNGPTTKFVNDSRSYGLPVPLWGAVGLGTGCDPKDQWKGMGALGQVGCEMGPGRVQDRASGGERAKFPTHF